MVNYREASERAKQMRRGIVEQWTPPARKKRERRWKVLAPAISKRGPLSNWWVIYRGTDFAACQRWIEKQGRSYGGDRRFRIEGPSE